MGRGGKSKGGWETKVTLEGETFYFNAAQNLIQWQIPEELLSREEIEARKGDWVWVPHPTKLWQPARKVDVDAKGTTHLVTEDGKNVKVPRDGMMEGPLTDGRKQKVPMWPLLRYALKQGLEDDLVAAAGDINEGIISHTLRTYYEKDSIYTWVGAAHSVLVAVNPYKDIRGLYTDAQVRDYERPPPNKHLAPHVFGIAANSYNALLRNAENQSILISGESGAGKTVATKHCLKWLAAVAGSESNVEDKILAANPLLEAFGNAKTLRNDNSSRFGKWIEVYVDGSTASLVGASITNYLLERSRLVFQQKGERNFHIFYQLTSNREWTQRLGLDAAGDYGYLSQSGVIETRDVDDKGDFSEVLNALNELEFSKDEQEWVFRTTAGVLTLGNVTFDEKMHKGSVRGSKVRDMAAVRSAADFLGIAESDLEKVLCFRTISVRREKSTIPLDPTAARDACGALAKAIYSKLFDYLVVRINESLAGREGRFIGILDIFGFEVFDNNSFEQLCINFANEKLQQHFNRTTFKEEESLYAAEGIDYKHIEFIDNQAVLDLIEKRPQGILLMLDEESLVPEGSNTKFMNKVESQHKRHPKLQVDKHRRLNNDLSFEVLHYAGTVRYSADDMMVKNTDTLFADMYNACAASGDDRTAALFPDQSRTQNKSVSHKFRRQLNDLMDVLTDTDSRYIRCIKPNGQKRADAFETPLVVEQLRYSGVFEAVDIRKQGYPFRLSYRQFRCRYACINEGARYRGSDKDICRQILDQSPHTIEAEFGRTLVLYRAPAHKLLTLLRNLALENITPVCQRVIRGGIHREFARRLRTATDKLADALSIGNDIDAMDEAIAAVDPTIGPLKRVFSFKPVNYAKAKSHRADLAKWKELEAIFERLNAVEQPNERQFKELTEAVKRANTLLHIPRTELQIALFEQAQAMSIYMSIRLQEAHIDQAGNRYQLPNFRGLREPTEYAKKKLMGKAKAAETMLICQRSSIATSLTEMTDKALVKDAKKAFSQLLAFAGIKKSKDPDAAGSFFLTVGQQQEVLRDELYCQVLKQLQQNPDEESIARLEGILGVMVSMFTPSEELEPFVLFQARSTSMTQQIVSTFHATKYGSGAGTPPRDLSAAIRAVANRTERSRFSVKPSRA